jgi:hypothetical protein
MSERLVVKNGNVLSDDLLAAGTAVVMEEGRIASLSAEPAARASDKILDARGGYVLPGFVDQHSHGMRDVMVDKDAIHVYAGYQLDCGVTACLPTLAADPASNMARMRAVLAETKDFTLTPNIVGFRPEIMYPGYGCRCRHPRQGSGVESSDHGEKDRPPVRRRRLARANAAASPMP